MPAAYCSKRMTNHPDLFFRDEDKITRESCLTYFIQSFRNRSRLRRGSMEFRRKSRRGRGDLF